jgi:uncharacterized membrane protein YphA (DoxX/SURF4 family)
MNTALWIAQVLLALAFGLSGLLKATQPYEKITQRMNWAKHVTPTQVRIIGTLEFLAAVGLIVPALTGILPWLTPLAAVGLILTMIGAALLHIRIGESSVIVVNFVLLAIAAFIAYGRFVVVPLS